MSSIREHCALAPEQLRWRCDEVALGFQTTAEIEPSFEVIGQDRAIEAIELSLAVRSPGYNVYVAGLPGSGRQTAVRRLLETLSKKPATLTDKCYVYNFAEPDRPRLLRLPAGQGCGLRDDMDRLVRNLRQNLTEVFESEGFQERRKAILKEGGDRASELFKEFEEELVRNDFQLVRIQMGPYVRPDVVPVVNEKPIIFEELESKVESGDIKGVDIDRIREKHQAYHTRLDALVKQGAQIERETTQKQQELEQEYAKWAITPVIETLIERYPDAKGYLGSVRDNILHEIDRFRRTEGEQPKLPGFQVEDEFTEYKVNVMVDNSKTEFAPVILETAPTFQNLFGSIEAAVERFGRMTTDHTRIHAGSLVRADGGFVVFNLVDAITEFGVWKTLKRALISGELNIRNESYFSSFSVFGMKPEPIPLNVKVCAIGSRELYHLLYDWDEDFQRVFKIKGDFDYEMDNIPDHVKEVAGFIRRLTRDEGLRDWSASGVAAFLEEAARRSGRKGKLTARFGGLADLVRQANYWAEKAGNGLVERGHVETAIAKKIHRTNLAEDKIRDVIDQGQLLIDTTGAVIGQVNGLAVYSVGDYQFGKPARITAKTGVGSHDVINIEREAKLSGSTHDKGVLILQGYMRAKYAQTAPVTLSASLCFEQSYGGVDGDSASAAELFALLSSLAQLPIEQGIAVTGSINQHGEIQAIGGVNEKIEGFFDVCKRRGLTGSQGAIIPKANVSDLMLHNDILEAVRNGQFHVWAIELVDEGLELLMGAPAGERSDDGTFPDETIHGRVEGHLLVMGEIMRMFEHPKSEEGGEGEEEEEEHPEPAPVDPTRDRPPGEEHPEPDDGGPEDDGEKDE